MKLNETKKNFLIKYQDKLKERGFLIDILTQVQNRPAIFVGSTEFPNKDGDVLVIQITKPSESMKYIPPDIPNEVKNPVLLWKKESGLELIHQTMDIYGLIMLMRNWQLMSPEQQVQSDKQSIKLFNKTNLDHYKELFNKFKKNNTALYSGNIVEVIVGENTNSKEYKSCLCYIQDLSIDTIELCYIDNGLHRVFTEIDEFTLNSNDIINFTTTKAITTTVGRFLLNKLLLQLPFGTTFAYVNSTINVGDIEKQIAKGLLNNKITVANYKQYVDNVYFIGHFTELCVPMFSRASLTTSPDIAKRKAELLKQHEGKLTDPIIISQIENELIQMDKDYLKNDAVMRFYKPLGDKPFNIARKKLYLTVGGIEAFSKDSGKYEFMANSLEEGHEAKTFAVTCNEIRKGSYNRGHETQLGGAQTKYIVRVFQDLMIEEADCGTNRGLPVDFKKVDPKNFIGHYIKIGTKWVCIIDDMLNEITGKKYIMRSAQYCQSKKGLCKICVGDRFSKLNTRHVTTAAIDISSTFVTMSLKLMHGSKLSLIDIDNLEEFVI